MANELAAVQQCDAADARVSGQLSGERPEGGGGSTPGRSTDMTRSVGGKVKYEVATQTVGRRQLAVVRERRKWSELGGRLIPLLDRVYAAVREGRVIQSGHNVFLFRDGSREGVTVEVGVEISSRFDGVSDVVCSATPAGQVASTVHMGEYSGMGGAHEAVIRWCKEHDRRRANVWWEVYGDWREDPAQLQTEVFHLLQTEQA